MKKDKSGDFFEQFFDDAARMCRSVAAELVPDPDAAVAGARERFLSLAPDLAYADRPQHPMASSLFWCAAQLSLYQEVRSSGIDAHRFGASMFEALQTALKRAAERRTDQSEADSADTAAAMAEMRRAGIESQESARPGEFVFEVLGDESVRSKWGMDIKACAICYLYGRHDALDLVPYMCATDDLTSDAGSQGLSRTGTIALGSGCCDFRYDSSQPGQHIAELYPERIRVVNAT